MYHIQKMMINIELIAAQIKKARLEAKLSQAELAQRAGVSRATINALENQTIREIGVRRLSTILQVAQNLSLASVTPLAATLSPQSSRIRKSETLALSFPYDWSNPNIADDVLIRKVIERGLFEDIAKVSVRYGLDKVLPIANAYAQNNQFAAPALTRIMRNIGKAVANA